MKKLLGVTLGIMTALGGFVDLGQIVFTTQAGALFGYRLVWSIVLGAAAIIICMEMCGRVAAVAREPVFAVVRRCLGFRLSLATLIASNLLNLVTCAAELGGIAIVLHLLTGWNERLLLVVGGVVGRHYIFISFSVDRTYFRPYGTAHDRIRRFRLSSFDRTGPVSPRGCFPWPPFRMETMPLSTGILRLESSAPC